MNVRRGHLELDGGDRVSTWLSDPGEARALLVFAHGAGAGAEHWFMDQMAGALAAEQLATLRYQFPYMEAGRRRPDRAPKLQATVRQALDAAARMLPGTPIVAGGKSMGGRMTSQELAAAPHPEVAGVFFYGFPLHPAGRPGTARATHLENLGLPKLFVQGTRDRLAGLDLLADVLAGLQRVTLHVVDGADHSFRVLKRLQRSDADVVGDIARATASWVASLDA